MGFDEEEPPAAGPRGPSGAEAGPEGAAARTPSPPHAAAAPPVGERPPPALFCEVLEQLHAAHRREVAYLEGAISRLAREGRPEAGGIDGESSSVSEAESGVVSDVGDLPSARQGRSADALPLEACAASQRTGAESKASSLLSSQGSMQTYDTEGGAADSTLAAARAGKSKSGLSESVDQEVGELSRGQYVWQWQRSKGGFRNYPPKQNARIEDAYRRGHSMVRIKSGREGQTPMEIFFVDMHQLDPSSRNIRPVRRLGNKSWYIETARHVQAIARSVFLGEPRWESFEKYKKRQQNILGTGTGELTTVITSNLSSHQKGFRSHWTKADNICAWISESASFFTISMLVTLLNVIWIGVSVELGEFNLSLWDRHGLSILLEHIFMRGSADFVVELMINFISMKCKALWFRSTWFCLDALCTASIVLEVLVVPYTAIAAGSTPALQVLRLTRLARMQRLLRDIKDVMVILRGMVSGMRSAAFIWVLIAILLYTCSVLLTTGTSDEHEFLRDKYFGSMGQTITTLVAHGIALDGVADFFQDLRMHHGLFQGLVFAVFVFLTYFGAWWRTEHAGRCVL
ncbi:unnamed protein product [Prorocentrum cordatum]|uniref:WWE domain-containing protein n=1 Tax=Prorocentrum cordatum TaxID=2364126 RepID=A0ABN9UUD0_9DINO|nr:unnamed protein product [Polarella glacialis]